MRSATDIHLVHGPEKEYLFMRGFATFRSGIVIIHETLSISGISIRVGGVHGAGISGC
ncbi:MAG TPA: hypothetical protein VN372_07740 [Methanospirillum sp.]|nr:hypothetical protein [Methanospirillum sp.]